MTFFTRFSLSALRPEGGIVKLKREGISLYHIAKTEKNRLYFSVKRKDKEKVFAILQNSCYNVKEEYPEGWAKFFLKLKENVGFLVGLGILLFAPFLLSSFIFRVEVIGEEKYRDYVYAIMEEEGLGVGMRYKKENLLSARLMTLRGVDYCFVQKDGYCLKVEIHSYGEQQKAECVPLYATDRGIVEKIIVLSGEARVKEGDLVEEGDLLIAPNGKIPCGKVSILCKKVGTKEELLLLRDDYISLTQTEEGFEMTYRVILTLYY
ncbi:MAG: sporulation protein YqfD [Clostridia bacterium]|nr:sporulation protein YqfD [Clostridia bacterium]